MKRTSMEVYVRLNTTVETREAFEHSTSFLALNSVIHLVKSGVLVSRCAEQNLNENIGLLKKKITAAHRLG